MMLQNSQHLNSQIKQHAKRSPERQDCSLAYTTKGCDKLHSLHSIETSTGDISQDLIKQLTLKNKLLNAQLVEYRTLVSSLNQRLQDAQAQIMRLRQMGGRMESAQKLHTIQEQLNSLSQITTKSRRREPEQAKQEYYFHQITQMLNAYNLHSEDMSWEAYIGTIEAALQERITLSHFAQSISYMKQSIEPGDDSLLALWGWLKKLGWNYRCLLGYTKSSRDKIYTKK